MALVRLWHGSHQREIGGAHVDVDRAADLTRQSVALCVVHGLPYIVIRPRAPSGSAKIACAVHCMVHSAITRGTAIVTLDNPPVNALTMGLRRELTLAIRQACERADVRAIVVTGAGKGFAAGADLSDLRRIQTRAQSLARSEEIHAHWHALEGASKPIVCAMHGYALGGGLELAMACHYRIATRDTLLGQPEISLGLIPGAGGTQRLPRLVGMALALELCTTGRPISAERALACGLIDRVVEARSGERGDRSRALSCRQLIASHDALSERRSCRTNGTGRRAGASPHARRAATAAARRTCVASRGRRC